MCALNNDVRLITRFYGMQRSNRGVCSNWNAQIAAAETKNKLSLRMKTTLFTDGTFVHWRRFTNKRVKVVLNEKTINGLCVCSCILLIQVCDNVASSLGPTQKSGKGPGHTCKTSHMCCVSSLHLE